MLRFGVIIVVCLLIRVSTSGILSGKSIPKSCTWPDYDDDYDEVRSKESNENFGTMDKDMNKDTKAFLNDTVKSQNTDDMKDNNEFSSPNPTDKFKQSTNETNVRKCCPKGEGFDISQDKCRKIKTLTPFNFTIANKYIFKGELVCLPSSQEVKKLVSSITQEFALQSDGTLLMEGYRGMGPVVFNTSKYCVDWFINSKNEAHFNGFVCHIHYDFEKHFVLTGSCMLIICFLILLRLVVFTWLPEPRNLHRVILMAYLVSFLVGFLVLGCKMLLMYEKKINREMCFTISFVVYFSILSAFFWRNVMCYDIWWTFSGKRAISGKSSISAKRLYSYCGYAFGGPTAFTFLLAGLEYSGFSRDHILMPKIWQHGCNSLYGYSKLLYFYGPIMILFVINTILFTRTALKIATTKKETSMLLHSKESRTHDQNDTQRFLPYVKLFAAMVFLEMNWIIEIFTIFYANDIIVLNITDLYNVVLLLVLFVNFFCQKKIWSIIKIRYKEMRSLPKHVQTTGVLPICKMTSQNQDIILTNFYDDAQSTDHSREKTYTTESQDDTQPTDHRREMNSAKSQDDDTQLSDYSREETNPAESQKDKNNSRKT